MRKNFVFSLISATAKVMGGIGLLAILARVFTLEEFGVFAYSLTFSTVLTLVVDYGYNLKLLNDISRNTSKLNHLVTVSLINKVLLFSVVLSLFCLSDITFGLNNLSLSIIIYLFIGLTFFSLINSTLCVFKSTNRYDLDALVVVFDNFLTITITVVVAVFTKNLTSTSLAFAVSKFLSFVFSGILYLRRHKLVCINVHDIVLDIKETFPFAIHYIIGNLYLNIDTLIIVNYVGDAKLAIYQAGIRVVIGSGILLTIANSLYMPILSSSYYNKTSNFNWNARMLNAALLKLGIIFLVVINLFSEDIIKIIFGIKFDDLNSIFWIFTLIIFTRIFGVSYGMLLTVSKNQYLRAFFGFLSVILIVVLDIIFVPIYGLFGAAIVLLIGHIILNSLYMLICYREFKSLFLPSFKQLFTLRFK